MDLLWVKRRVLVSEKHLESWLGSQLERKLGEKLVRSLELWSASLLEVPDKHQKSKQDCYRLELR